jgi:hypothetical protein
MIHTHETAPTQFVEANGIRLAYRRFGSGGREGLLGAKAYAKGRRRPAHVDANNGGAARGYHRVASTSWRTFCGSRGHQTADPCR